MPKRADKQKEEAFLDAFCSGKTASNATQSALKAGYKESSAKRMGSYLRKKYEQDIIERNGQDMAAGSSKAISRLIELLDDESSRVRLDAAVRVLEINKIATQNININIDRDSNKTDEELIAEFNSLIGTRPKLSQNTEILDEDATDNLSSEVAIIEKKPSRH